MIRDYTSRDDICSKALIVDDSIKNRNLMQVNFKYEKHLVVFAENGRVAINEIISSSCNLYFHGYVNAYHG